MEPSFAAARPPEPLGRPAPAAADEPAELLPVARRLRPADAAGEPAELPPVARPLRPADAAGDPVEPLPEEPQLPRAVPPVGVDAVQVPEQALPAQVRRATVDAGVVQPRPEVPPLVQQLLGVVAVDQPRLVRPRLAQAPVDGVDGQARPRGLRQPPADATHGALFLPPLG